MEVNCAWESYFCLGTTKVGLVNFKATVSDFIVLHPHSVLSFFLSHTIFILATASQVLSLPLHLPPPPPFFFFFFSTFFTGHVYRWVSSSSGTSSFSKLSIGTIQLSLNSPFSATFFSCISGCTSITSSVGLSW